MRTYLLLLLCCALLPAGCSNKTTCQQACEKQNSCASSLDCSKWPAAQQNDCQFAKTHNVQDCSAITTCGPTEKSAAQKLLDCQLDQYCSGCKTGSPEAGADTLVCRRPPSIFNCFAPPNARSSTLWYCSGCGSFCGEGTASIAACSLIHGTGDCRYFADGCYPTEYWPCDGTGSDSLQFLCGHCFFGDDGGLLKGDAAAVKLATCNKLPDGGTTPADGGKKQ